MRKFVLSILIVAVFLLGCGGNSSNNGSDVSTSWTQKVKTGGDFAMSGAFLNGKSYLGGYGSGKVYSYPPLSTDKSNTGEAVLGATVFNNLVYMTSENNGSSTRVFKRNGGWSESRISGRSTFFVTVWNNQLVVTSTGNLASIDVHISSDGNNFSKLATVNDWLWVPAVYRGELYLLGHGGRPYGPGGSKAVKWDGGRFVDVPALCNVPGVTEWQCATEHNGQMFLGSGGWTMARGSSTAAVYQFDGSNISQSKVDGGFHEVQALLSSRGVLYATMGHGFKSDGGGSMIWAFNGSSWVQSGFFPDIPQLYVLIETSSGYLAAGGRQGQLVVYESP